MISFTDFEDPVTKKIDWGAYHHAEVAAGQKCTCCGDMIYPAKGHPSRCSSCEDLDADPEVRHDHLIRCPACGNHWKPQDTEDYKTAHEDGDHEVNCPECDHEFTVTTSVSYTYTSPARLQDPPEAEPEDQEPDDGNWACGTGGPDC